LGLLPLSFLKLCIDCRIPTKLIFLDEEGQVVPVITIHDPSVDPDKVIFKTRSGTEFKREKFDKTTGRYVLNLVGVMRTTVRSFMRFTRNRVAVIIIWVSCLS